MEQKLRCSKLEAKVWKYRAVTSMFDPECEINAYRHEAGQDIQTTLKKFDDLHAVYRRLLKDNSSSKLFKTTIELEVKELVDYCAWARANENQNGNESSPHRTELEQLEAKISASEADGSTNPLHQRLISAEETVSSLRLEIAHIKTVNVTLNDQLQASQREKENLCERVLTLEACNLDLQSKHDRAVEELKKKEATVAEICEELADVKQQQRQWQHHNQQDVKLSTAAVDEMSKGDQPAGNDVELQLKQKKKEDKDESQQLNRKEMEMKYLDAGNEGMIVAEIVGMKRSRPLTRSRMTAATSATATTHTATTTATAFAVATAARKRRNINRSAAVRVGTEGSTSKKRWTEELDKKLHKAYEKFGMSRHQKWVRIAAYVGKGVCRTRCRQRWNQLVEARGRKTRWTADEDKRLQILGEQAQRFIAEHSSDNKLAKKRENLAPLEDVCLKRKRNGDFTFDWTAVSARMALNGERSVEGGAEGGAERGGGIISASSCKDRWRNKLRKVNLKRGAFTAEEDSVILRRRREWRAAGRGPGLWEMLEKELGRPSSNIRLRWKNAFS